MRPLLIAIHCTLLIACGGFRLPAESRRGPVEGQAPGLRQPDRDAFPDLFVWQDTCNVHVLRDGDAALLVDLGDGSVLDQLERIGVKRVEWVLFTHHHREQCQGASRLARWREEGTRIAAPAKEKALFEEPNSFRKMDVRLGDRFTIHGSSYVRPPLQPVSLDRALSGGETFTWRGHAIRCIDTPGNSPGGMTYLLTGEDRLAAFSGDVLLEEATMHTWYDTEWDYGFGAGIRALRESVARLQGAAPDLLLPSHGPVVRQPTEQLKTYARKLERLEKVYLRGYPVGAASASQDKVSTPTEVPHVARVSTHLFKIKKPDFWGNFGLILADSGRALVVDCGLLGESFLDAALDGMRRHLGLKAIDAVIVTHMHGDHFLEAPHLREKWSAQIWALDNMVDKMEHPEWFDYAAPIQAYGKKLPDGSLLSGVSVDRAFRPGETFEWEGYRFTVDWMPGQTEFALCLHGRIDGRLVAFTGDNIFGDPDDPTQNGHEAVVAHNSAILEEGYIYAAEYLTRLRPDILVGGHSFVMDRPAAFIERYRRWAHEMRDAFRALSSEEDYRTWFDPFWVRAEPYRVTIRAGESADVTLHVRNFRPAPQGHLIDIHPPPGLHAEPDRIGGTLEAESRGFEPIRLTADANAKPGVRMVTFDVTLNGRRLGERFDLIVSVDPPRNTTPNASGVAGAASAETANLDASLGEGYRFLGRIRPRHARDIRASNWSIGAETMDRDYTIYASWREYLGPLGVKKARIQSGWAKTEKERGVYDWAWVDEIVEDMARQGVEPWVCLCYGNPIYPGGGGTGLGGGLVSSEEALEAWERYVAAFVERYQEHVDEWEIWNEPRTGRGEGAVEYARFVVRTARTIRERQPEAEILFAAGGSFDTTFARQVLEHLREEELLHLVDAVIYHPYSYNPDDRYDAVEELRRMARSFAPHLSIRQGENGAPSQRGSFGAIADADWTETSQAKWALRRLLGDLGRDIPSSYFAICDMKYPSRINYKGLLAIDEDRTVHHVKVGYRAVQHLTALFDDTVERVVDFEARVAGGTAGHRYAAFGYRRHGEAPIVTVWRSSHRPGERPELERIRLTLPDTRFTDPVWVDLLSGRVYAMSDALWRSEGEGTVFPELPVHDSPVLVAERKALADVVARDRPNVLLVCVDDLRSCLELDGDPIARTPHLDRLASEGRYFRSHFVQVAACGPSRGSLLTGRRIIESWDVWSADRKLEEEPRRPVSIAHHFRRHGYSTVSIGKVSHEPSGTLPPRYEVHQLPFSWDRAFAPVGRWANPWHAFFAYADGRAYNAVIRWVKSEPPRSPFERGEVGDDGYADHYIAEAGIEELKRLSAAGKPFFLAVGFYKPHLPHNSPARYWDLFPANEVGMPDNFHPPSGVDPSICIHQSPELTAHYEWPSGLGNISREEAVRQRRAYYAAVAYVDAQIGRLLAALRELESARQTIVVLWSDHGWQLGEHRMFSKHSNYEVATRSPLIIQVPGMKMPGVPADGIVESVDLFPTLAELCGLPRPKGLAGESLRDLLDDPLASGKPGAYSTHRGGRGYRGHALRTRSHRLVRWINEEGDVGLVELYDHRIDPAENVNVAERFPYLVEELTRRLQRKMDEVVASSHQE